MSKPIIPTDPVESIFREVVLMKSPLAETKPDVDPYQSEEYQRFVESMVQYCHCKESNRPCDGVLAGGLCDGIEEEPERYEDKEDDEEEEEL